MTAKVLRLSDIRRSNRERQRRQRARVKKCRASTWVDYGPEILDVLVRRKYLTQAEVDRDDKAEIGRALTVLINVDVVAADK